MSIYNPADFMHLSDDDLRALYQDTVQRMETTTSGVWWLVQQSKQQALGKVGQRRFFDVGEPSPAPADGQLPLGEADADA